MIGIEAILAEVYRVFVVKITLLASDEGVITEVFLLETVQANSFLLIPLLDMYLVDGILLLLLPTEGS